MIQQKNGVTDITTGREAGGGVGPRTLVLATATILALGLLVAPRVFHNYDVVDCFLTWSRASEGRRPWDIYLSDFKTNCDYPPVVPYLLTLVEAGRRVLRAPETGAVAIILVKLPNLLAYLAAVPLCALGLRRPFGDGAARTAALLAALSPALFANAAAWGQFDALLALLVMAAVVALLHERPIAAGALMGVALGTKLLAIVAVPALAVWTWKRLGRGRLVLTTLAGLAVIVLLCLPYLVAGAGGRMLQAYLGAVDYYPVRTAEAYNGWYLLDRFDIAVRGIPAPLARLDSRRWVGPVTFREAGVAAFGAYLLMLLVGLARRPTPSALVAATALSFFGFFMLPTQVHQRYLVPAAALVGMTAARSSRRLALWAGVSLTAALNQALDLTRSVLDTAVRADPVAAATVSVPGYRGPIRVAACVVAVFNIALFIWATRDYWREVVASPARPE
jgi:4-amino-4-deoxy-L-arabinose transferase-like glycosyltransferase